MASTRELTIHLPEKLAELVSARILSGEFADESAVIESALIGTVFLDGQDDGRLEHWMKTEGTRRCQAMDADPSRGLSVEQAFAFMENDDDLDESKV